MKPTPTLRQLRYLVAVIDRRHFGQAAEACFVGQSTLSAGIQELENLLGASLLERTKRSVVPTALGLEIAARARPLLKEAEALVDLALAARDPMAGPLNLGVIPTIGPFLIPRAMPVMRARFPKLQIYLREDQTARLLAQLQAGQLDAVLLALPYPLGGLEPFDLGSDRFWLVCPPGHRLGAAASVGPSEIALETLLLLEEGHCLREQALDVCTLEGARRNVAFEGTSLLTLVQMVASGLGVTFVPQMALDSGILRGLDLAVVSIQGDTPSRRIGLVWRPKTARRETFRRLGTALKGIVETT